MSILVTGGAGYIGSHTCVELLNAGHQLVVVDNLSNSNAKSLERVQEITRKRIQFYKADLLDRSSIEMIFEQNPIEAVVHLAGLKAVGESVQTPLQYYENNVTGTVILCEVMKKFGVKKLVFSSSATVYGVPKVVPIPEHAPLGATNPYGRTKLMIEEILRDLYSSDSAWSILLLRYFNPIGAHPSGLIGEDPAGTPNNLLPYISQVAIGKLDELNIYGADYPTPDGTGIRDYIHVVDLARGHQKAVDKVLTGHGIDAYNLGTGKGCSVLEMVRIFEKVSGKVIPYRIVERRPGDVALCYADPTKAKKHLGWCAEYGIEQMCRDSWAWNVQNPDGYGRDIHEEHKSQVLA
ncbi:UDP-glucose 4-epimerase GalE [Xylanibacillus composti]|uniref:UDP-glucose 4-epimerase n=1 Tax=Xylanibacillus composti TaxID=1572762 RepID=A0A8J4M2E0_9BACL|nr:UDP-glucose 4-epimerase GalE [Xylanibacillus composti]MDT9724502.1 UDP-glucose 4-epimerase GalE [Xylanibacillus composti]GIQ69765.1 UDP-glucose 4-epimerase [Xylanibacillus composti]